MTEIWVILSVLNVEIRTLSYRPLKSGLMWLRELLHPMDYLERMYSLSIAMYPSKCVCIHASVPQCLPLPKSVATGNRAAISVELWIYVYNVMITPFYQLA